MFTNVRTGRLCRQLLWLLPACAALLLAADPAWKSKPIPGWTAEDARQILTDSPWAKIVTAGIAPLQNEDQRREGGNMGQSHGVGFDGVDRGLVKPKLDLPTILSKTYTPPPAESVKLQLRWETALPIRAAELKAGELDPPSLEGEGYKLAVYGIPGKYFKGDPEKLGEPLRKVATLRREGKKDVMPSRVEVFQREDGNVVVYLFPASAEISKKDSIIEFDAQIGRIVIRESFDAGQMQFQGRMEL